MEIVLGLECKPVQAWWGASDGQCLDLVAFAYFNNITNLVSDLWIFLLPIPTILQLVTDKHRKMSLCLLFSVGLGTCAISAARLTVVVSEGAADITCTSRSVYLVFDDQAPPWKGSSSSLSSRRSRYSHALVLILISKL